MRAFKIKYIVTTHSRCGTYTYGPTVETVKAEDEEAAAKKLRAQVKEKNGQWRTTIMAIRETGTAEA